MELQYSEIEHGIKLLTLIGRLDIAGVGAIENKFSAYCSGENARVAVDLSEVDFLASSGIRLLTLNAKAMAGRGGKMVLVRPTAQVREVLDITGILAIVPLAEGLEAARMQLRAQ